MLTSERLPLNVHPDVAPRLTGQMAAACDAALDQAGEIAPDFDVAIKRIEIFQELDPCGEGAARVVIHLVVSSKDDDSARSFWMAAIDAVRNGDCGISEEDRTKFDEDAFVMVSW